MRFISVSWESTLEFMLSCYRALMHRANALQSPGTLGLCGFILDQSNVRGSARAAPSRVRHYRSDINGLGEETGRYWGSRGLLGNSLEQRKRIVANVEDFYRIRSRLIHHGREAGSKDMKVIGRFFVNLCGPCGIS